MIERTGCLTDRAGLKFVIGNGTRLGKRSVNRQTAVKVLGSDSARLPAGRGLTGSWLEVQIKFSGRPVCSVHFA